MLLYAHTGEHIAFELCFWASSERRRRWQQRAVHADEHGGAAGGQFGCLCSFRRGVPLAEADQVILRARLRQLMKEKFLPAFWLADGSSMFEIWHQSVSEGKCICVRSWSTLLV